MVKLALTDFGGEGDEPPLVLLHGLLGTARNLTTVARGFTQTRHVVGLDLRNHGASPWVASHSYPELAEDVAETLTGMFETYDLLGHSMGGKTAMTGVLSGLLHPQRLIVGEIAPVGYSHTQAHMIELMQSVDLSSFERRAPLARHLGDKLGDPVFGQFLAQAANFLVQPVWTHNLNVLLDDMDDIIGFPDITGRYDHPTLVVAGAASDYVDETAVRRFFPKAMIEVIEGAGHWVHAEAPARFNEIVADFLDANPKVGI